MALGGADGAVHILRALSAETGPTMAVVDYQSLMDLTPDARQPTAYGTPTMRSRLSNPTALARPAA